MCVANSSDLSIELGDRVTLAATMGRNYGKLLSGFLAKGHDFISKVFLKHRLSGSKKGVAFYFLLVEGQCRTEPQLG